MADKETNDQKQRTDSAASVEASAAASANSSATSEAGAQATAETSQSAAATAELQAKLDKQADQLLRAQAEIVNMQNRHQKEQANLIKYDGQKLATDVLPVLDNLERALETAADDEASKQLKKGVQMVYKHLEDALKKHHVTEIPALGEKFDPNVHQAVQSVPAEDGQKADTVVKVLQKGYLMKDRTLRPAMVVVAQ